MNKRTQAIRKKDDVRKNPDNKIDQDFTGYPHGPAKEEIIRPRSRRQKETAAMGNKDGEKRSYHKAEIDEQESDGSANAFEDK
ncbi:MAG: hypothetical protein E6H09_11015 [Bacteroidetes bacterium]|nr:MAG: hypothetical protein E6H09_11015 [Bacteroidota bacterium]